MPAALVPIVMTLSSCTACVVFLEYLTKLDAGSMNLLTFSEFLFIALEGLIFQSRFFTVRNRIPISGYLRLVFLFWSVNVVNNQALNFHVPLPLHIIIRSGSLLANMALGIWMLNKRYSKKKYLSVLMITVGIVVCTLATSSQQQHQQQKSNAASTASSSPQGDHKEFGGHHQDHTHALLSRYGEYIVGVLMLFFALIFSALLGIEQEKLFCRHGRHPREALFYCHALPLPLFLLMSSDIRKHFRIFNESVPYHVPLLNSGYSLEMPILWYYLFWSVITQYVCIRSIYVMSAECPSLTVTLVITLRKFVNLLISIFYFRNPFTPVHWLGTSLVFAGTLLFADVFEQLLSLLMTSSSKRKGPPQKSKSEQSLGGDDDSSDNLRRYHRNGGAAAEFDYDERHKEHSE